MPEYTHYSDLDSQITTPDNDGLIIYDSSETDPSKKFKRSTVADVLSSRISTDVVTDSTTDIKFPSTKAVKTYADCWL